VNAVKALRRIGLSLLVVLVVLACVVGGTVFFTIRASLPDYAGTVKVPGLDSSVQVYRDSYGIPQVYAQNADDLFRAQGYLHAVDRFWEMDFRRHVTAGRLAELFGPSQVATDTYIRTMGWRRVAEQELSLLSADTRRYLQAYADGVNAWIGGHSGSSASLEYAVLKLQNSGYRIEQWTPVDSLSWLKAMAWDLRSNMSDELERAQLLASGLSGEQINQLYPEYPYAEHAPILGSGAVVDGTFRPTATVQPARGPSTSGSSPVRTAGGGGGSPETPGEAAVRAALAGLGDELGALGARLGQLPGLLGTNGEGIGSNSWVVGGGRTATGKPLLANDPHLGPVMPSVWYQVGLHCTEVSVACPFDVAGFSFSGVPGVVIGHTAKVAWGFTNLGPDVTDLFLEKVSGDGYERDGEQVPLVRRTERIEVAGGDDVTLTVRSTVHGPLLSDQDEDLRAIGAKPGVDAAGVPTQEPQRADPAYAVALSWTALQPGRTADAVFALNRVSNFDEFRAAAKLFAVPAQNMIYADVDGNIGYQAPGTIPIRGSGDGLMPAPGWNPSYDWAGTVPFEQMPYTYNPPAGYIVTANQAPVREGAGPVLGYDWDYGYRSARIDALLQARFATGKVDAEDMSAVQTDDRSGLAPALVPALAAVDLGDAPGRVVSARKLLTGWDYHQSQSSAGAAYFNAIWRHVLIRTFDELPDSVEPDGGSRWFQVVTALLKDPRSPWWDERGTSVVEGRDDVLRAAMRDAADELTERLGDDPSEWRWGDLHTLTIRNQSLGDSGIGMVEALFNRGPYPVAGGSSLVNATGSSVVDGYEVSWVPSMRMVVDLADLDRSRWVNLTGDSGHAFSDHYTDQVELWRNGETTPMRWRRETIRDEARYVQKLTP